MMVFNKLNNMSNTLLILVLLGVLQSCLAIEFSCSGDNEQWVYADGVPIGHMADWTQTLTVTIPAGTIQLAVKIADYGVIGGFLGSSSDSTLITDGSWKCTRGSVTSAWESANYDDSQWPAASTDYTNGQGPWGTRPGISSSAFWIWNSPYVSTSQNFFVYCRKRLLVADPCSSNPCQNGGDCTKTSGTTFTCNCAADYNGENCQTLIDPCTSSPCRNGGTCGRLSSTDFTCNCVPDYDDGDTCTQYQNPCLSAPCLNGGTCVRSSAVTFTCSCTGDYLGNFCELRKGINPCANDPCQHGGTCTTTSSPSNSPYTCKCTTQYEGQMCEKLICMSNPTTDCDLIGTMYGKYGYCGNCTLWSLCRAKKRRVRSCARRAPNIYFDRANRNCSSSPSVCNGLIGY